MQAPGDIQHSPRMLRASSGEAIVPPRLSTIDIAFSTNWALEVQFSPFEI